jgi:ribosome-associated toxin RatA of RatAB toxin-antitoxin module
MSRRVLSILILATLASSSDVSGEDTHEARLDRGEVIVSTRPLPGASVPEVYVEAIMDAPPQKMWALLDRCGDYSHTMIRMKDTKELSRSGDTVRCESTVEMPWPLPNLHGVLVARLAPGPPVWMREWKLESGDYKRNDGSWVLKEWPHGRTFVEYRMRSEPNTPVPQFIQGMAAEMALQDMMKKFRKILAQPNP